MNRISFLNRGYAFKGLLAVLIERKIISIFLLLFLHRVSYMLSGTL